MNDLLIERQPLLQKIFGNHAVTQVDVNRVTFPPRGKSGRHIHPCPVVGYIVSGSAYCQIEGESAELYPVGSAFYEPANRPIADFGNASDTIPMTFIAFYLLDGDQKTIEMLPPKPAEPLCQGETMTREILWNDAEEIGIQLQEKFPDLDPLAVRFTDLHRYVTELEGFADDAAKSTEGKLEAIQMAWHEEYEDAKS